MAGYENICEKIKKGTYETKIFTKAADFNAWSDLRLYANGKKYFLIGA